MNNGNEEDAPFGLTRRHFLASAGTVSVGAAIPRTGSGTPLDLSFDSPVLLSADGPILSPIAFASLLRSSTTRSSSADTYGAGGLTAELETYFAAALGKEAALFLPTGTLANQVAIQVLSGTKTHVVVQAQSHVFRDEYDIAQTMSGKTLLAVSPAEATFSVETLEPIVARHRGQIGAISIETPVRRLLGERFEFERLKQVGTFARERDIRMHLDGARIFIESAYTGIPVRDYAAWFDTVYVCLYKCFGAGSGAVLCGSRASIDAAAELRNLFGARLFKSWPYAAVALRLARGFGTRFAEAKTRAERFFERMNDSLLFRVEPVRNGTNVFRLYVEGESAESFRRKVSGDDLRWSSFGFTDDYAILRVNETWNQIDEDALFRRMKRAVAPRRARLDRLRARTPGRA